MSGFKQKTYKHRSTNLKLLELRWISRLPNSLSLGRAPFVWQKHLKTMRVFCTQIPTQENPSEEVHFEYSWRVEEWMKFIHILTNFISLRFPLKRKISWSSFPLLKPCFERISGEKKRLEKWWLNGTVHMLVGCQLISQNFDVGPFPRPSQKVRKHI